MSNGKKQKISWIIAGISIFTVVLWANYANDKKSRAAALQYQKDIVKVVETAEKTSKTDVHFNKALIDLTLGQQAAWQALPEKYKQPVPVRRALNHIRGGHDAALPLTERQLKIIMNIGCNTALRKIAEDNILLEHLKWAREELIHWENILRGATAFSPTLLSACSARLDRLYSAYYEKQKSASQKAGESLGRVSKGLKDAWGQATAPISSAVDDFRRGYRAE